MYSKALNATLEIDRIIGQVDGAKPGPCLIFIGGIHGNEPSGVFALHRVFQELRERKVEVKGSIIALAGNLWALERAERFQETDLNRLWTSGNVKRLEDGTFVPSNEDEKQQKELYYIIQNLFSSKKGPFYFFDLHTTSSKTTPFLTVNDSLLNRKFTRQYPAPIILGIEEYLDGPILSYINELGYVAFGFESGQHDDPASITNHIAFTYLSLVLSGAIARESVHYDRYFQTLGGRSGYFYEIYFRYQIKRNETFAMEPGFVNFQKIRKGELLAKSDNRPVFSHYRSLIFMPLYQAQGEDGFFMVRKIPSFFLWLSAVLRKWRFDRILPWMPGITWATEKKDTLVVDLKIARFMAKQFLHILGYRNKRIDKTHLIIKNRETASRNRDYEEEVWN